MQRPRHYILVGRRPLPANPMTWARWYDAAARLGEDLVADETIGASRITTVFLGINPLDEVFNADAMPRLFETMVIGGPLDGGQWRCSTWDEAEAQHKTVCDRVRGYMTEPDKD